MHETKPYFKGFFNNYYLLLQKCFRPINHLGV
nr:MAG TPA: hypothetical protein [Caudoviricetes sp.]